MKQNRNPRVGKAKRSAGLPLVDCGWQAGSSRYEHTSQAGSSRYEHGWQAGSSRYVCACVLLGLLLCGLRTARAEEGMIPLSELAQINLAEKGIELTAREVFNPEAISLVDGVCRVNGCTGSFVSDRGLIITNHHCAFSAIQTASTAEADYLRDGFRAATRVDEIPALDYTVRVTEDYRDVSAEVLAAVGDKLSHLERTRAIDKRRKELEAAAEQQHPGLRAEVAEMFAGKTYVLFLYTYLKDIRLVFAPPQAVGNFGGEEDNWMWPRHTGDFSFMRAYTAPDGSSATYAAANVPYQPKRFIQVEPAGVQEEDAVFLLGYPGKTARHKTASFLEYEQDVRLPLIVELYNWQIGVMAAQGAADRSVEIQHASRMRSLANVEKRSRGQLKGLHRASIVEHRRGDEAKLQQFIQSDPARKAKYGHLLAEIKSVYQELAAVTPRELLLQQLRSACVSLRIGHFIFEAAVERQKADLEREADYMDRNFELSVQEIKTAIGDFHAETDQLIFSGLLQQLARTRAVDDIDALRGLLADEQQIADATRALISQTQLGNWGFVEKCLSRSPQDLADTPDPLLRLMAALQPTFEAIRDLDKEREGKLGQLYAALIEVKQEFLATDFVPDANGTLRFTCGRIRGYSPEDAVIKTPITTLRGVIDKTTGVEPFITPVEVIEKYRAGDLGRFRNADLNDVPVAILYDTDTTGGNSGSPILNARGELVGVNFDRCFEATINDFAWNASYSRSIGVDIRYALWITGTVYGAEYLLAEMGVPVVD